MTEENLNKAGSYSRNTITKLRNLPQTESKLINLICGELEESLPLFHRLSKEKQSKFQPESTTLSGPVMHGANAEIRCSLTYRSNGTKS